MARLKVTDSQDVRGGRPRPRVALLGVFDDDTRPAFSVLFPTIWEGPDLTALLRQVNPKELDLLIIGTGVKGAGNWSDQLHVICFSDEIDYLPGPIPVSAVWTQNRSETEEFMFPSADLEFDRLRKADFSHLTSAKGFSLLEIRRHPYESGPFSADKQGAALDRLMRSALISDPHSGLPFAVIFVRDGAGKGVAWLPLPDTNIANWVDAIVRSWASNDPEVFGSVEDWMQSPRWTTQVEKSIVEKVVDLERRRTLQIERIDKQIAQLNTDLQEATQDANQGLRRLITAQGDMLVAEVSGVLSRIGFEVQNVDELLEEGSPKREDLRLTDPRAKGDDWEAIVEVRGYRNSAGKAADLQRLSRFEKLYQQEKGRFPGKLIYVINPQTELSPDRRELPLASAEEDIRVFAESGGLVVSTLDLFQVVNATDESDLSAVLESLKYSTGRWHLPQNSEPLPEIEQSSSESD